MGTKLNKAIKTLNMFKVEESARIKSGAESVFDIKAEQQRLAQLAEAVLTITSTKTVTKESLRQYLISEGAVVIKHIVDRANGNTSSVANVSNSSQDRIFDALLPIIHEAGDLQKIEANTVKDVLALVSEGKITIQDAKDLVEMIKEKPSITIIQD